MGRKKDEIPRERMLVVGVATVLCIPIAVLAAWPSKPKLDDPARGYMSVCPPAANQPLVILTYDSRGYVPEDGTGYTEFFERFVVFDPQDGRVLHRESLGVRRDGVAADCFAAIGDHVWLWTKQDGYHIREARTARVVKTQDQLIGELATSINAVNFDPVEHKLYVSTKDGRTHVVDDKHARTVVRERSATSRRPVPHPTVHEERSVKRLEGQPSSKGVLQEDSHQQRRSILVDGEPLAGTDWLEPEYVLHPPSKKVEWPGPASLIVCQRRELGKPKDVITRVTLDGKILWTYLRQRPDGSQAGGDCRWHVTGDGKRLVMFVNPNGMIGLDPVTGREAFLRTL